MVEGRRVGTMSRRGIPLCCVCAKLNLIVFAIPS